MKLPDRIFGIDTKEAYQRHLEESQKPKKKSLNPSQSLVADVSDFWRINNVEYRNGIYAVDLAKALLDNESSKTQDVWVQYSIEAQQRGDFYVGNMQLYHALFSALSRANSKDAEEAKEFIKKQMRDKWLMTLTRVKYNPNGDDEVIHNYGTNDSYVSKGNIVGKDEFISQSADKSYLESLLGTDNVQEINKVYQWLNGTDAYIFRVNSKPKQADERIAGFVAGSGGVGLDCIGDPRDSDPALGVRRAKIKT